MGATVFAALFLGGALLLALWSDFRLGEGAPARFVAVVTHLVAAALAVVLAAEALAAIDGPRPVAVLSVMGIFLPAVVYLFVSTIWVLKIVQRSVVGTQ